MSRDLTDFADSVAAMPKVMQRAQRGGVRAAALHVTRAIRFQIKIAVGGDSRMSGVGRKGAKVGAGYNVRGKVNPTALISARGPLHLIERDTEAHYIEPKKFSRKRSRSRATALRFSGMYSRYADHPGTKGKHPFARGVNQSKDEVVAKYNEVLWKRIKKEWS